VIRIVWSPRSIRDLEGIHAHIAEDSPPYADLVVQRLASAPDRLAQFPDSGRMVPERADPELRELILRPFRIVYRRRSESVEIATVFRSSMRFPDLTG